ncbi:hypothetical protein [Spongiactinospora sp. 9N601]
MDHQPEHGLVGSRTERLAVSHIVTLDYRNFSLVRPRHVPAFTLLPGISR